MPETDIQQSDQQAPMQGDLSFGEPEDLTPEEIALLEQQERGTPEPVADEEKKPDADPKAPEQEDPGGEPEAEAEDPEAEADPVASDDQPEPVAEPEAKFTAKDVARFVEEGVQAGIKKLLTGAAGPAANTPVAAVQAVDREIAELTKAIAAEETVLNDPDAEYSMTRLQRLEAEERWRELRQAKKAAEAKRAEVAHKATITHVSGMFADHSAKTKQAVVAANPGLSRLPAAFWTFASVNASTGADPEFNAINALPPGPEFTAKMLVYAQKQGFAVQTPGGEPAKPKAKATPATGRAGLTGSSGTGAAPAAKPKARVHSAADLAILRSIGVPQHEIDECEKTGKRHDCLD